MNNTNCGRPLKNAIFAIIKWQCLTDKSKSLNRNLRYSGRSNNNENNKK